MYPNQQAIVQAVDVCIKKNIFKDFLLKNKKEVVDMVFFEYDAEAEKRVIYKDGRAARHGLPFGSYITLADMVSSSL